MKLSTPRSIHDEKNTHPDTEDLDTYGAFHGPDWMSVLTETYNYKPVLIATGADAEGTAILPLAEVVGVGPRHGVSLPFTDFCEPYSTDNGSLDALRERVIEYGRDHKWKYVEFRAGAGLQNSGTIPYSVYYGHELVLEQSEENLWRSVHENARRNIHRAEKEKVVFRCDTDWKTVKIYYDLHCRTRKKLGVPPQPEQFFRCLQKNLLDTGKGFVGTAFHRDIPVAATLFLLFGRVAVYKFGASDERYLDLRANALVMWKSLVRCRDLSVQKVYMGRTDMENDGLRRYKKEFGAQEYFLPYYRFDYQKKMFVKGPRKHYAVKGPLSWMPIPFLRLTGKILYPFMG